MNSRSKEVPINDIHYPSWEIKRLEQAGVDTTNLIQIKDDEWRGATTDEYATEWSQFRVFDYFLLVFI